MNYILSYYQHLDDGTCAGGKWVKLLYKYIVEGLQAKSFFFDQKKADRAIRFIEFFCRHHEGVMGGKKIVLEEWQKE